MGQLISCSKMPDVKETNCGGTIRIVDSAGLVRDYLPPVAAKDILVEYPDNFMFNAKDLQACNPRPLMAQDKLLEGNVYFLFHLTAHKSMKGDEDEDEDEQRILGICDTPGLQMEYINILLTKCKSRSWRPHLGTIDETSFPS